MRRAVLRMGVSTGAAVSAGAVCQSSASSTPSPSFTSSRKLSTEEVELFHKQGYLVIKSLLQPDEVSYLRESSMKAWRNAKCVDGSFKFDEKGTWLDNALLPNVHHLSKACFDYYFGGPLVSIAVQLVGSPNIKATTSQLTFKTKGNNQKFEWHHDNLYGHLTPCTSISCLTALDKVTLDNGCVQLIPGSNKNGQLHSGLTPAEKRSNTAVVLEVDESLAVPMLMEEGDCLIMHCHTVHCSKGNHSDGDRRILFCRYSDADAVEVYNGYTPRLGRVVHGSSSFPSVANFERDLPRPAE